MEALDVLQQLYSELPVSCPTCDGNDSTVLGNMGMRMHLRCDCCGWTYNATMPSAWEPTLIEHGIIKQSRPVYVTMGYDRDMMEPPRDSFL